jgi:hypothetical protein
MKITQTSRCLFLSFSLLFGSLANAERVASKERWEHHSIKAKVESIDLDTRKVTLRSAEGSLYTITVDERVKRLNQVKPGDTISTDFYHAIKAEFRNPTLAELQVPIMAVADGAISAEGEIPAGAVVTGIKAVVTIEAISRYDMSVTVRDALGDYTTFAAEDEIFLQQLSIGEFVIITSLKTMAISLEVASNE